MMEDLISRQDVIDEIRKCRFVVDAIEKIRGLPSAQSKEHTGKRTETHACDLIKRQDAIDAVNSIDNLNAKARGGICFKLMGLPSVQPDVPDKNVGEWIPCSERLPDLWDERYLVSLAWGGVGTMEYKSTGFHNYGSFSPVPIETVTAWMPLPEPYAERREE